MDLRKTNRRNNFPSWNIICLRLPGSPGQLWGGISQRKVVNFEVFERDKIPSYLCAHY